MTRSKLLSRLHWLVLALGVALFAAPLSAAGYPPLSVEIRPEHPLLVFRDSGAGITGAADYARHVIEAWQALPDEFRPLAAMQIEAPGDGIAARHEWYRAALAALQDAGVPIVIRLADRNLARIHPIARAEELLRDFTCIKAVQAVALPFEEYYAFGDLDEMGTPPVVQWLVGATGLAARYGRLMLIELDEIRWPRVMSNTWCQPLYAKFRECREYVAPIVMYRGAHTVPQTSAVLGLWLEGAVDQWGVGPDSAWYRDARFIEPGVFGVSESAAMPAALYRAMILNGAMTGASVYSFPADQDLWFGANRVYWDDAIRPTLSSLIARGLIARQDFVHKKTKVAYQLAPSATPLDFHFNLRDIDGILDQGNLMRGAYGMERPGQVAELILNTGRHYWVPILSARAPPEARSLFDTVVSPGVQNSPQSWRDLLNAHSPADGEGTAFVARVGRGTFVMNTRENQLESQTFRVAQAPAPVRGAVAKRQETGVVLTWPFREGDLAYKVHRRIEPATEFTFLANVGLERQYFDTDADRNLTVAYAVTTLTDDVEPYEGTVGYGEYLTLSNVESRIVEEIVLAPMLSFAEGQPLVPSAGNPAGRVPVWPNIDGVLDGQRATAAAIAREIEAWDRAFAKEDLSGVIQRYAADYEDPQGWRRPYVRRAYQWFFERYDACRMDRQIRQWDFSAYDLTGQVSVLLYCRFAGNAASDPTGRFADIPAHFPRGNGEVWVYFTPREGDWRIIQTNPSLPNMRDILSFSASPADSLLPGPDR
ncbi:MAG: hypothetical protein GWP08_12970 [Nitrospiraceae bacterium]|nr:hypothetical protein [Nitrospiraceae bacterium]